MSCISEENYQMAVTVVRNHGTGSVSNLQRKMHWGYNQAATAIERMESEFIVGPMSESGRREVFPEQIHELWKEKESLKAHDTEITPEITEALDSEISQLENAFIEKHFLDNDEAEQLEMLIAKAMKLGELYAKRDAKAQVPEGFVLVSESKISCFYQDNDEPENCCLDASGFDSLGDCIDDGEVMLVNKFTQANISKQQMFGAWCACDPKPLTRFIKEFKLFDTQEEAEQAMIKALEQN